MPAAYDTYDYPSYWKGRDYEHNAEIVVIKELLDKIPEIKTILEIGAGYGRLTPSYIYRAKKVILSDPSARLLKIARKNLKHKNLHFIQASYGTLDKKLKAKTIDVVIHVRVLHHIEKPEECFKTASKLLRDKGYLILEFANKSHFKASLKEFLKGNLTYPLEIFPKDIRSKKAKKKKTLPFYNFHPDTIEQMLKRNGLKIIEKRSVSNIRSQWLKKLFSTNTLILLEKVLQKPLAKINFGPSIFILARKEG